MDDLKANTPYHNFRATDDVIKWFWNTMKNFTEEERARFIQFVTGTWLCQATCPGCGLNTLLVHHTGTSKVPVDGFRALQGMRGPQKFNIHKAMAGAHHLPTAHTCFNQLDLPVYSSEDELRERLQTAIRECEGFGLA